MAIDDDMEVAFAEEKDVINSFKDRMEAVNMFFSERNIDQKSRLMPVNVEGMIECGAINTFLQDSFGITDPIISKVCKEELSKTISLEGKGRDEVIKLFHAIEPTMNQPQIEEVLRKMSGGGVR
jgi:hypothetical protein